MTVRGVAWAKRGVRRAFGLAGLEVSRRARATEPTAPVDDGLEPPRLNAEPVIDSARLRQLTEEYAEHELSTLSGHIWAPGDSIALKDIDPLNYRGDNAYVWQARLHTSQPFALAALWATHQDAYGLLDRTEEDGAFGADCIQLDGRLWSRDLIDSILEITFLRDHLGDLDALTIADIGAGYGRLAHRLAETSDARLLATDGVAMSTALCESYMRHRGLEDRVQVVPLTDSRKVEKIDLATNIHSFSEMSLPAVRWWLGWLSERGARHLFVVPNRGPGPAMNDGTDLTPIFREHGFDLAAKRAKYADPLVARWATYPGDYYLFSR